MEQTATINVNNVGKEESYRLLKLQLISLIKDEPNEIANLGNFIALVHHTFRFWWTGFYFVDGKELVLGSFQGPVACTRIPFGKGVCGTAWKQGKSIIVPNVHEFEGHIACSSETNSEIVIPVYRSGKIVGVFDIDSKNLNTFDEVDAKNLSELLEILIK